jgi:5-methylcytosine-specific restriction endonuclease McrA
MSADYLEFLDTPEWWTTRKAALERADYACEECGARGVSLEVHHLTYQRLGVESPDDLEVRCRRCHEAAHDKKNLKKRLLELLGQLRLFSRWTITPVANNGRVPDARDSLVRFARSVPGRLRPRRRAS